MDFEKINPLYLFDGNALVTSLGDVSVCYKIDLPEINTVPLGAYNDIHSSLMQLFNILRRIQWYIVKMYFSKKHGM